MNTNVYEMTMLHIYNSHSKQKVRFTPLIPGKVSLYVCGMTVYDYCHIGHARTMVSFDTIVRHLRASGYEVTYVRNITDIDDKIIQRALENNESIDALTTRFIDAMNHDAAQLHIESPTQAPRATDYIASMVTMIERLITEGHAYVGANGDVLFDVASYPAYGTLSGQDLSKLRAGTRLAINDNKHDPLDFVLWKCAKPGEPAWATPWGIGRPGWHIECSAMAQGLLGAHFDLHGGGHDLLFPHHENELAQSVCANHQPFVNTWLHTGFVQIDDEKMSKSLGNFFTIREVLEKFNPELLRYFLISAHYRSPINYSDTALKQSGLALTRLYQALRDVKLDSMTQVASDDFEQRFEAAMNDDFNTPEALGVLHEVAREINRLKIQHAAIASAYAALLIRLGQRLGILMLEPEHFFQGKDEIDSAQIEQLIQQRHAARITKQWASADAIRDQLLAIGIVLEDNADGVKWKKIARLGQNDTVE